MAKYSNEHIVSGMGSGKPNAEKEYGNREMSRKWKQQRKEEIPIRGADMQKIWEEEIEKILPGNVSPVYVGVPVRAVYKILQDAEEKLVTSGEFEHTYTVYSDPVDTGQNFPETNRMKYFPTVWQNGHVKFAAEENAAAFTRGSGTPNVSGTALRQSLESCDLKTFQAGMPAGLDSEKIFNTLCPAMRTDENLIRAYIQAIITG